MQASLEWLALRAALGRRRAISLTRLYDSSVVWREPCDSCGRLIVIEEGDVSLSAAVDANAPPPIPPGYCRPVAARREVFTLASSIVDGYGRRAEALDCGSRSSVAAPGRRTALDSRDLRRRCGGCDGSGSTATILHADLDAFYASVEQLLDPRLRGKPIEVGRRRRARGPLRSAGLRRTKRHARQPARRLCLQPRVCRRTFREYQRLGDAAIGVVSDFTPSIERISIDEAFADVPGSTHLFRSPAEIATTVRAACAPSLACQCHSAWRVPGACRKMASQVAKPDGLAVDDTEI